MKTYNFTAYGENFVTEAETSAKAMSAANRALIWPRVGLSIYPGGWFETNETEFRWLEGNFFD